MIIIFVLAILFFGYGVFTIIMRIVKPESLKKYFYMKNKYGNFFGFILHFTAYSLLPIILGLLLIIKYLLGI